MRFIKRAQALGFTLDEVAALLTLDVARACGETQALAGRKLGLIEQDPASGHYGLGPLAMQLGLISLQQVDPVRLALAALPGLARRWATIL